MKLSKEIRDRTFGFYQVQNGDFEGDTHAKTGLESVKNDALTTLQTNTLDTKLELARKPSVVSEVLVDPTQGGHQKKGYFYLREHVPLKLVIKFIFDTGKS